MLFSSICVRGWFGFGEIAAVGSSRMTSGTVWPPPGMRADSPRPNPRFCSGTIHHFLCESAVRRGALASRVIEGDRHTVTRGFGEPHSPRNERLEHLVLEEIADLVDDLL